MRIEGASISAAARVVGASVTAVSSWLKKDAIALERMRASGRAEIIAASTIAFDEMWAYLGTRYAEKRNALWVWTAVVEERAGGQVDRL